MKDVLFVLLFAASCRNDNARPLPALPPASAQPEQRIAVPGAMPSAAGNGSAPTPMNPPALPVPNAPDTSYQVSFEPVVAKVGQAVKAKFVVTPGPGYKVNHEFPHKVVLTGTPDVAIAVPSTPSRLVDEELVFDVAVTPARAGTFSVAGQAKFAVCTPQTCDPKKVEIAVKVTATE